MGRRVIDPQAAIKAAMSVARDVAGGQLDAGALEDAAVAECRALFGAVVGPGDALWPMHVDVARQVLAVGAGWISADELAEWVAVYRAGEGAAPAGGGSWIERALAEGGDEELSQN